MAEEDNVIDLAKTLISPAAFHAYREFAERVAQALTQAGIEPRSIPDEQARMEADGSMTIFVVIPNFGEISMSVPKGHWAWARRQ